MAVIKKSPTWIARRARPRSCSPGNWINFQAKTRHPMVIRTAGTGTEIQEDAETRREKKTSRGESFQKEGEI